MGALALARIAAAVGHPGLRGGIVSFTARIRDRGARIGQGVSDSARSAVTPMLAKFAMPPERLNSAAMR